LFVDGRIWSWIYIRILTKILRIRILEDAKLTDPDSEHCGNNTDIKNIVPKLNFCLA
jgi:hypothetical protein